jgi:hypothetical protein
MALLYPILNYLSQLDIFLVKKGIFPRGYLARYSLDFCSLDMRSIDTN